MVYWSGMCLAEERDQTKASWTDSWWVDDSDKTWVSRLENPSVARLDAHSVDWMVSHWVEKKADFVVESSAGAMEERKDHSAADWLVDWRGTR
jgi:diketogulonate reductase-like aldo/keto reductase